MKRGVIIGVTAVFIVFVFLWIKFFSVKSRDTLSCSTVLSFHRNDGLPDEVRVNAVANFYFRSDGTGTTTYKGAAATRTQKFNIDRDLNFNWTKIESGEVIQEYTQAFRRHNDNTPNAVWGAFASPGTRYYLMIEEVGHNTWLISDRCYPTYICRGR